MKKINTLVISFLLIFISHSNGDLISNKQKISKTKKTVFIISKKSKHQPVIVIGEKPVKTVDFAAAELQKFIKLISGVELKIVNNLTDKKQPAIILGDNQYSRKARLSLKKVARDGYRLKTTSNHLYILGKDDDVDINILLDNLKDNVPYYWEVDRATDPNLWGFERGTLFGVYRFLEMQGASWFYPGKDGQFIPPRKDIVLSAMNIYEKPHFELRVVGPRGYSPKQLLNDKRRFGVLDRAYMINKEEFKAYNWSVRDNMVWFLRIKNSTYSLPLNHYPPRANWLQRFAKTKPEYFGILANGQRDFKLDGSHYFYHLCYTNKDVFNNIIEDIVAYSEGKSPRSRGFSSGKVTKAGEWSSKIASGKFFSVLPNDNFRACQGKECKKFQQRKNPNRSEKDTDLVWNHVTKLAKELKKRKTDIRITNLAYETYSAIPQIKGKIPDNVIVGLCPATYNKVYNLPNKQNYTNFIKLVDTWGKKTEGPLAYWLHYLSRYKQPHHHGIPAYMPHFVAKLYKDLSKRGKWMYMQLDTDSPAFVNLNRYLMNKLSFDPNLDVDVLLNDYYSKTYGKAFVIMKKVMENIEMMAMSTYEKSSSRKRIWEELWTEQFIKSLDVKINTALKLPLKKQPRKNLELFRDYFIGNIKRGSDRYNKQIKIVNSQPESKIVVYPAKSKIVIDGVLNEEAWNVKKYGKANDFYNNVNSKKTEKKTTVKVVRDLKNIYISFTCYDKNAKKLLKRRKTDYIEVSFDINHNHDSYYQILLTARGKLIDIYHIGGGEAPQPSWQSGAETAIKIYDDRWVAELKIPRKNMDGGKYFPHHRPWGVSFCRTQIGEKAGKDKFSSSSPYMLGPFNQPDVFGHLLFQKIIPGEDVSAK